MGLLAECPVCRRTLHWTYLLRPLWSQWRCPVCGSLLGIDKKRRLLAIIPFAIAAPVAGLLCLRLGLGQFTGMTLAVILWAPYFLALDRATVLERCGFRCRQCGYNLQGQVVPRCPECGREFDAEERALLETGVYPRPTREPRRPIALATFIVMLLIGVTLLAFSIAHYSLMRVPVAPGRPVATQPAGGIVAPDSSTQPSAVGPQPTPVIEVDTVAGDDAESP